MADAAAIAAVRAHIGSGDPPSDADISTALDAGETVQAVALRYLRLRLGDLLASPLKQSWGDDYSEDWGSNAKELRAAIAALETEAAAVDDDPTNDGPIGVMRIVRAGRRR